MAEQSTPVPAPDPKPDARLNNLADWLRGEAEKRQVMMDGAAALLEFDNLASSFQARKDAVARVAQAHSDMSDQVLQIKQDMMDLQTNHDDLKVKLEADRKLVVDAANKEADDIRTKAKADVDNMKAEAAKNVAEQTARLDAIIADRNAKISELNDAIAAAQKQLSTAMNTHNDVNAQTEALKSLAAQIVAPKN